jgi:N-acetyl-gamma-glutamyl-phosphate reductase
MAVTVVFFSDSFTKKIVPVDLQSILATYYAESPFIKVQSFEETPVLDGGCLDCTVCNGTNCARIHVFGNEENMQVTTIIDNLGKGASGAAVQNMNIALGLDETIGL